MKGEREERGHRQGAKEGNNTMFSFESIGHIRSHCNKLNNTSSHPQGNSIPIGIPNVFSFEIIYSTWVLNTRTGSHICNALQEIESE